MNSFKKYIIIRWGKEKRFLDLIVMLVFHLLEMIMIYFVIHVMIIEFYLLVNILIENILQLVFLK